MANAGIPSIPEQTDRSRRRFLLILGAAALILEFIQFAPVLGQGLMRDDFCWLSLAREAFAHPSVIFSRFVSGFFRPVVHVSFIATYAAFGDAAWPFYVTNLLLDAMCAVAVAMLALELTRSRIAAAMSAATFVTHSHHAEVVAWVSARTSSLMALFCMLTLIGWARFRRIGGAGWAVMVMVSFAAALGAKEEAAVLLPLIAALDLLVRRGRADVTSRGRQGYRSAAMVLATCTAIFAGYLAAQYGFQSANPIVTGGGFSIHGGAFAKMLTRVPHLFIERHIASPVWAGVGFVAILMLGVYVLRAADASLRRAAIFGVVMAFVAILPTSFFREEDYPFRYDYLATCGAAIAWGALAGGCVALIQAKVPVRTVRVISVALLGTIGLSIPTQAYRLRRALTPFESDARHGGMVHAAVKRIGAELETAREAGSMVILDGPPLPPLDMQCLCHLVGGIPRDEVIPVHEQDSTIPPDAVRIQWNGAAKGFEVAQ